MTQFLIDLYLDGYDTTKEHDDACKEFIKDQLDFSASCIKIMEPNSLKLIKGDLLEMANDGFFDYIVHGCNCFTTMGSGIARKIALMFPEAELEDKKTQKGDKTKLGKFTYAKTDNVIIINAYTQYNTSSFDDVFEYAKFYEFLDLFEKKLRRSGRLNIKIGFPLIGCGLARGNRGLIQLILERFAEKVSDFSEVYLVEYDK